MKIKIIAPLQQFFLRNTINLQEISLGEDYFIRQFEYSQLMKHIDFFKGFFDPQQVSEIKKCKFSIFHEINSDQLDVAREKDISDEIRTIIMSIRLTKPSLATAHIFIFSEDYSIRKVKIPFELFNSEPNKIFTTKDFETIKLLLNNLREIKRKKTNFDRVKNSINFFEIAHQIKQLPIRLVTMVAALESLFNTDSEQIATTIALRISFFLEDTPEEREKIFTLFKEIYSLRSIFAHGQKVKAKFFDKDKQSELMVATENLVRKCLIRILKEETNIKFFHQNEEKLESEFNRWLIGTSTKILT